MVRYLSFILVMLASLAPAGENSSDVEFYGSFLHSDEIPNALFFFSEIRRNDSFELRKALRTHEIDTIVLSSPGGSVFEGLQMAGIIFDKQLRTYVPKDALGGVGNCASACSFMFLAGKERKVDGNLGVHQFVSIDAAKTQKVGETQQLSQFTVSEIIGFLNEFDTPPFVYERMFQQKEMYYFSISELEQLEASKEVFSSEFVERLALLISSLNNKVSEKAAQVQSPKTINPANPIKKQKPLMPKIETDVADKNTIKKIQAELNRLGCNAGKADGIIGRKTRQALDRFSKVTGKKNDYSVLSNLRFYEELLTHEPIDKCYVPQKKKISNERWSRLRSAHLKSEKAGSLGKVTAWAVTGECKGRKINETWYSWNRMQWHYIATPNLKGKGYFTLYPDFGDESVANLFGNGDVQITRRGWNTFRATGSGCSLIQGKIVN